MKAKARFPTAAAQVVKSVLSTSILSKILFVVIGLGYFLSFSQSARHVLTIAPGNLFPPVFWIWTLATFCFIETRIFIVLSDFVCIHLCSKLIEPLWGQTEVVKYFLIVNCSVALFTTTFFLILYYMLYDTDLLFSLSIHGLSGFNGAMVVAVKQILPDDVVISTPLGKLKNSHLPGLILIVLICLTVAKLFSPVYLCMFIVGAVTGWVYLRFYQRHTNGTQGDMADHFAFANFFPAIISPFIAGLSGAVYALLVRLHVCKPTVRRYNISSTAHTVVSLPGIDPQDAERRRQKALKDLNERLSKVREQASPGWPSLDDSEARSTDSQPPSQPHSPGVPTESSSPKKKADTIVSVDQT